MRMDWDTYFCMVARIVSYRSTCARKQVGCVIVKDNIIVSTGYNGTAPGEHECRGVDFCTQGRGHGCNQTIHAEQGALTRAAPHLLSGSTAYVTLSPCYVCFKMMVNAGVKRIVYLERYKECSHLSRENLSDMIKPPLVESMDIDPYWANKLKEDLV